MVELKRIATYAKNSNGKCEGGVCPAFFKGTDGNYYVQGKIVTNDIKNQIPIGADEDLISIPTELLIDFFNKGEI